MRLYISCMICNPTRNDTYSPSKEVQHPISFSFFPKRVSSARFPSSKKCHFVMQVFFLTKLLSLIIPFMHLFSPYVPMYKQALWRYISGFTNGYLWNNPGCKSWQEYLNCCGDTASSMIYPGSNQSDWTDQYKTNNTSFYWSALLITLCYCLYFCWRYRYPHDHFTSQWWRDLFMCNISI